MFKDVLSVSDVFHGTRLKPQFLILRHLICWSASFPFDPAKRNFGLLRHLFYKKLQEASFDKKFIKPVAIIYVILNIPSVFMNIFGRISLAVFVQVVAEAIEIKVSSCSRGIFSRINVPGSPTKFRNILSFISVLLWILVSAINLNIIDSLVNLLQQLLLKPRTLGNVESDLDLVKKLVAETINGTEEIVKNVPRQILFNSIAADNVN